jgi:hypothetical protein
MGKKGTSATSAVVLACHKKLAKDYRQAHDRKQPQAQVEQNHAEYQAILLRLGLRDKYVAADGNCLYYVLMCILHRLDILPPHYSTATSTVTRLGKSYPHHFV